MEPGQRILKVHADNQQVADCFAKITTLEELIVKLLDYDRCSNVSTLDEGGRKIAAHQITASDLNTFTNTFLTNMRMFVTTTT